MSQNQPSRLKAIENLAQAVAHVAVFAIQAIICLSSLSGLL